MQHKNFYLWSLSLSLVLLAVYIFYSWGFSGVLQFDDEANLGWLQFADTPENALLFITSGNSGPLGRPIALASFYLLNSANWPHEAAAIFRINTLIHLLNGLLVVWLFILVGPADKNRNHWFGLITGIIWLIQPMLVSTSLMAVQRMTSLSATFVLGGLLSYVIARQHVMSRPIPAITAMSAGILVFGVLAAFTKENGLLLPGYILVLEYTLLASNRFPTSPVFRRWRVMALWLPCLLALAFLLWKLPSLASSYGGRTFTMPERLQTELLVLLDYARLLIFPERSELGPFRDDYPIYSNPLAPEVIAGLTLISALIVFALKYRQQWPFFSFAILWFLLGHSMESTIIPLEIYFEHRNYLPAVGIAALIATLPWRVPLKLLPLAKITLLIYCLELAFVLWQTTSTWGNPMLAATLWHDEHPASERAALMLAAEYGRRGDNHAILRILDETAHFHATDMGLSTSALYSTCYLNDENQFRARFPDVLKRLENNPLDFSAIDALEKLSTHRTTVCNWVINEDIRKMTAAMMNNPLAISNNFVKARLHRINATLAWNEREFQIYVEELEQQFLADPQLSSGVSLILTYTQEELWDAAAEKLTLVESRKPKHPLQLKLWSKQLTPLRKLIETKLASAPKI